MKLSRIRLLFPATIPPDIADRQITVLGCCCRAAKKKLAATTLPGSNLTGYFARFTIDDLYAELPHNHGSPMRPTWRRNHSIQQVIATLHELYELNYIDCDLKSFDDIKLTDELFSSIAQEWVYVRGARPHRIEGETIYAATLDKARHIGNMRTARLARLARKEEQYA